jgi:hypothetical protein
MQSQRVVQLLATCIRAAVRKQFGYEMSRDEALTLARVHSLRSALDEIRKKMELHQHLQGTKARTHLAVAEASLQGHHVVSQSEYSESIIAMRSKTLDAVNAVVESTEDREMLLASLRRVRRDWQLWADEYMHFFIALVKLYEEAKHRLAETTLEVDRRKTMSLELEKIFADVLLKSR